MSGGSRAAPVARVGARILVIDDADRVLLVEEAGSDPLGDWHHWLTPGGGVEAGEPLPVAATREVVEETGVRLVLPADARPIHRQRRQWSWRGVTYDQVDHYFAARVSRPFAVRPAGLTEMELLTVIGAHWWTLDELRASTESFVPPDVADVVAGLIAADTLPRPLDRPAGRVLVLDRSGSVLMIHVRPDPAADYTNWIVPGGGCDPGESPAVAAARELAEETGIRTDLTSSPAVSVERAVFPFDGRLYDQTDHFFVLRVAERPPVDDSRLTEKERAMTLEYRWWNAVELRAAGDAVYWPADLPALLERLG